MYIPQRHSGATVHIAAKSSRRGERAQGRAEQDSADVERGEEQRGQRYGQVEADAEEYW